MFCLDAELQNGLDRLELEVEGLHKELDNLQEFDVSYDAPENGTGMYSLTHEWYSKELDKKLKEGTLTWADMALVRFYRTLNQTDPVELKAELLSLSAFALIWHMQLESQTEPYWDRGDLDAMDTSHLEESNANA